MKKKSIATLAMAVSLTTLGFANAPQATPATAEVAANEEKTVAAEATAEAAKEEQKGSATAQTNVKEEAAKAAKITTHTKK